jgi:esterase/lipase
MTVNEYKLLKKINRTLDCDVAQARREMKDIKNPTIHETLANIFQEIQQRINEIHPFHYRNKYSVDSISDCSDYEKIWQEHAPDRKF